MVLDVETDSVGGATSDRCIFCAIVRGDAPAEIVLDSLAGIAFLDRRPLLPGHVLLVPRMHVATLPELPVAEALVIDLPPAIDERHARLLAQLHLGLTTREVEVLGLVAEGRADKEIASVLDISRHTASNHVAAIRAKLAVPSRTGAVAAAREAGLL